LSIVLCFSVFTIVLYAVLWFAVSAIELSVLLWFTVKDRQLIGRNCKPKKDRQLNGNQRLSRACIVHPVIKKSNWSYVKTMYW
jgi:hypothetical protein